MTEPVKLETQKCPQCDIEFLQLPLKKDGIVKILQLQCPKCCLITMCNVDSFDGKEYIIRC